jgi:hypothetical protein
LDVRLRNPIPEFGREINPNPWGSGRFSQRWASRSGNLKARALRLNRRHRTGNVPKPPGRAGGGPSPPGFQVASAPSPPVFGRKRPSTGAFGGRPEPVFEAPGKRGFRCGRPDRDAIRKQAASGVSAPEHRPDRPEIRHAPRNTAERGSARSAVRQALQTPRGVPRGSESARRVGPRLIPA